MLDTNTAIITRFHYEDDAEFEKRFAFYCKRVLPTVLAQTDQNFDIAVWCEPRHANRFAQLSPKMKPFTATYEKRGGPFFADFTDWENVSGLKQYEIQVGLDSDDVIAPDYIETIHRLCRGERSILVTFNPLIYDIRLQRYGMIGGYGEKRASAFFALYYPGLRKFYFAYCDSHLRLGAYVDKVIIGPDMKCCALVHGMNDSTGWMKHPCCQELKPHLRPAWIMK